MTEDKKKIGNPLFGADYEHSFKQKGEHPLDFTLQIKIDQATRRKLDKLGRSKGDFLRAAISEALLQM